MSMTGEYPEGWFTHHFEVGEFVELKKCPGAVFEVVEQVRDYDGAAMYSLKFVGPRKGIPPRTIGRLHKHFRIKTRTSLDNELLAANPMLTLAVASGG